MLHVRQVSPNDAGFYTCRMTFNLSGIIGVVAETIECGITGEKQTETVAVIHRALRLLTQLTWVKPQLIALLTDII